VFLFAFFLAARFFFCRLLLTLLLLLMLLLLLAIVPIASIDCHSSHFLDQVGNPKNFLGMEGRPIWILVATTGSLAAPSPGTNAQSGAGIRSPKSCVPCAAAIVVVVAVVVPVVPVFLLLQKIGISVATVTGRRTIGAAAQAIFPQQNLQGRREASRWYRRRR